MHKSTYRYVLVTIVYTYVSLNCIHYVDIIMGISLITMHFRIKILILFERFVIFKTGFTYANKSFLNAHMLEKKENQELK